MADKHGTCERQWISERCRRIHLGIDPRRVNAGFNYHCHSKGEQREMDEARLDSREDRGRSMRSISFYAQIYEK